MDGRQLRQGLLPLAQVPRPLLQQRLTPLSQGALSQLHAIGIRGVTAVDAIVMDFLPGLDVASHFFAFILRAHGHAAADVVGMTFEQLHEAVAAHLGFEAPASRARDADERAHAARRVIQSNARMVRSYLRRNGYTFRGDEIAQIDRTVRLLHANGIRHYDLHERNVMCHEGLAYVIDFGGSACPGHPSPVAAARADDGDLALITELRAVTTSDDEDQARLGHEYLARLASLRSRLESRGTWQTRLGALAGVELDALPGRLRDHLRAVGSTSSQEVALDEFVAIGLAVASNRETPPSRRAVIVTFLEAQLAGPSPGRVPLAPFLARRLRLAEQAVRQAREAIHGND